MRQNDLFDAAPRSEPPQSQLPRLDDIRVRLGGAIRQLRESQTMPWRDDQLRSWQLLFQNMTNWLPADERLALQREFAAEVARLLPARAAE